MSQSTLSQSATEESTTTNPLSKRLLLLGLALIAGWLIIKGFMVLAAANSLLARQEQAQVLLDGGLMEASPEEIETFVLDTRRDIVRLKSGAAPFLPLAPLFSWLPKVGPLFSNAPELLEMADGGSEAAVYTLQGLKPALVLLQEETPTSPIPQILNNMASARPELSQAALAMERVTTARAELENVEQMPWTVQNLLDQFDSYLPLAQDGLVLAQVLPQIMGQQGQRQYLIIAQNEDELRPTGGFISGAGLLVVENGDIISVVFEDAYQVDDFTKPYDLPPEAFSRTMGMDIFLFRDANFWPDFPTSAETLMGLYTHGTDQPVDGIIAIDQRFVQMLLQALGPLYVPELDKTITGRNVLQEIQAEWGPQGNEGNWVGQRKSFMGPLAAAVQQRIQQGFGDIDPINLARTVQAAADQRHLQLYMREPEIAAALAKSGWDGRLNNPQDQDILLVVDTSLGFNKTSAAMERTLDYQILLGGDGNAQATLDVIYTNTVPPNDQIVCEHGTPYDNVIDEYSDLINDCYWNYLRVYAPAGSTLLQSSAPPTPGTALLSGQTWAGEAEVVTQPNDPLAVFANFILVPPGQQLSSRFTYQLPQGVTYRADGRYHYQLTILKQAGLDNQTIEVTVILPEGVDLESSEPEPTLLDGREVTFQTTTNQDFTLTLNYR